MTDQEAKVQNNENWQLVKEYTTGIGPNHYVRVYKHKNGPTLSCDSWLGQARLNMYGCVENIEHYPTLLDAYGLL